jgi:hypothetical protein
MTGWDSLAAERFDRARVAGLDEPVRHYLGHALAEGAQLSRGVRLQISGHIRVGVWLRFASDWEGDGRSFSWEAMCGPGPFPFLQVHDQFVDGVGFMDIRVRAPLKLLPALKLLHAEDDDTARSGAGRAALEAPWAPAVLLPERGVRWRAESDEHIVAPGTSSLSGLSCTSRSARTAPCAPTTPRGGRHSSDARSRRLPSSTDGAPGAARTESDNPAGSGLNRAWVGGGARTGGGR